MRFLSDDASFGFRMTRASSRRFYIFQIVLDGVLIGDTDPCVAGSCFGPLAMVDEIDEPGLRSGDASEAQIDLLVASDDQLDERTLKHLAESLDAWAVRVYAVDDVVHVRVTGDRETHSAAIPRSEFEAITATMRYYWEKSESAP